MKNKTDSAPALRCEAMVRTFVIQEAMPDAIHCFYDDPDFNEFETLNEALSALDADHDQNGCHFEIYAHRIIERTETPSHYLSPNIEMSHTRKRE